MCIRTRENAVLWASTQTARHEIWLAMQGCVNMLVCDIQTWKQNTSDMERKHISLVACFLCLVKIQMSCQETRSDACYPT